MSANDGDRTIVQASIELAHKFGKRVVAEGVEDTTTLRLLEEMGCDQAQGYLISRPLAAEHLARSSRTGCRPPCWQLR